MNYELYDLVGLHTEAAECTLLFIISNEDLRRSLGKGRLRHSHNIVLCTSWGVIVLTVARSLKRLKMTNNRLYRELGNNYKLLHPYATNRETVENND